MQNESGFLSPAPYHFTRCIVRNTGTAHTTSFHSPQHCVPQVAILASATFGPSLSRCRLVDAGSDHRENYRVPSSFRHFYWVFDTSAGIRSLFTTLQPNTTRSQWHGDQKLETWPLFLSCPAERLAYPPALPYPRYVPQTSLEPRRYSPLPLASTCLSGSCPRVVTAHCAHRQYVSSRPSDLQIAAAPRHYRICVSIIHDSHSLLLCCHKVHWCVTYSKLYGHHCSYFSSFNSCAVFGFRNMPTLSSRYFQQLLGPRRALSA